ncbi:hypothetical protein PI125_g2795 [Phytophthora idaei]|nr:hypothetical protein PI125_g2795 [Phytophthora idaei]KAG3169614.1 hypothetical protein PI126_g2720 [Phytophthora idaei]
MFVQRNCSTRCRKWLGRIECTAKTCRLGEPCSNRPWAFYESTPAKLEVRDTVRTGAGLFSLEPVSKGTLVCEYLGEIIDELEKGEREKAGDCEYASNKSIDAKYFGNIARYCNHSCNPNCIADEWTVQGVYRIGISALKTFA